MKILLTGASGFLGRRLANALAARHELRLLLRATARREGLPAAEIVLGDIADPAAVEAAAAGCEAIVHGAALVRILAPRSEFERVNVGGTAAVVAAARRHGVARLLHVSSFMALGPTEAGPGGELDEAAEPADRRWINEYERTKTLADRLVRRAAGDGLPALLLYPTVVYGPGDLTEGNLVVRHLLDLAAGRVPALLGRPERRWNYVHVDDAVAGAVAALERGRPGGRYLLGGETVRLDAFYRLVSELGGIRVPSRRLPDPVATLFGALAKGWARLAGGTPQLTPDLVEVYRHDWAYRSDTAVAELGYRPRTLAAGLAETLAWLRAEGRWP